MDNEQTKKHDRPNFDDVFTEQETKDFKEAFDWGMKMVKEDAEKYWSDLAERL